MGDRVRLAVVQYRILRACVDAMTENVQNEAAAEGDCCICLEPFQSSFQHCSRPITTNCGHTFHPVCLITSLGNDSNSSCPLCRCIARNLVPTGIHGDCLRFLAMVFINVKAVQCSFEQAIKQIEQNFESLRLRHQSEAHDHLHNTSLMLSRAEHALAELDAVLSLAMLNTHGFSKILNKFDRRTGFCASASALAHIQRHGFATAAKEASTDGGGAAGGRCSALRRGLQSLLRDLQCGRPPPP